MIGNLVLPGYVGDTASKVKTLTVALFNSTTTMVCSHWNRVDREMFWQVSNDVAVCLNAARLECRKLIGPKYRDQFFREVSIRFESCTLVKKYDFPKCPKSRIRSEILLIENPPIECMLAKIVWTLLQNSKTEIDFRVHDDRIRAWNTRFDEENLFRKIGSPSFWDIFEADDRKGKMNTRMISKGKENSRTRSFSSNEIQKNLSQFADDRVSITSGAGNGEPSNDTSFSQSRETCHVATKDKQCVLHSSGRLFGQDRSRPTPATSKTDNKTRNSQCSRSCDEYIGASNDFIGNKASVLEQSHDINRNYKRSQERKNMNLLSTPEEIPDKDGLTIHIPSNVQKIVLLKDGRKITVEL